MNITLRAARVDEAAALTELAFASKGHWGYSADVLEGWRPELTVTPETIGTRPTWVAAEGDDLLGTFQLRTDCAPWDLEFFWVSPCSMGRGLGRLLLGKAVEIAKTAGQDRMTIDADPNAASFYEHCGARQVDAVAAPICGQPDRVRPQLVLDL